MVTSRTESFLIGRSEGSLRPYLRLGGALFLIFALASIAYHLLLERLVPGWPKIAGSSVVRYGTIKLPYSDVTWTVYLGLAAIALAVAIVAAFRQQGIVASLVVGIAPFLGFIVGSTIYYGSFTAYGRGLESPMELLAPIGAFVLFGAIFGSLGFLIGRTVFVLSDRFTG